MPSARTHDLITIATGVALAPITYRMLSERALFGHAEAMRLTIWLVGAHLISGILFSPDLDLDSAIDDRWGVLRWIWRPYMRVVPHRHFWSHSLVFAPLLRLAYFYVVITGLIFLSVWGLAALGVVVPDYHLQLFMSLRRLIAANPEVSIALLAGFCSGSAAHTVADWAVTSGKQLLARLGLRIRRDYSRHDDSIHRRLFR